MDYKEMLENARKTIGPYCKACAVCNGKACGVSLPGPGSKAPGNGAARNFDAWQKIFVNMDAICSNDAPDTSYTLFGRQFDLPVFAAPIGALALHYGEEYTDYTYNDLMIPACINNGSLVFTGDGVDSEIMKHATRSAEKAGGAAIPTIKPWNLAVVKEKLDMLNSAKVFAAAMDIDGAGLPFLKALSPDAGSKTVSELKEIIEYANMPFIIKGIMTPASAVKAVEAGAAGIVVSNHGGRVLGQTPATATVLPDIVKAVAGRAVVFVDGGIRTGTDVFKALALGADAVLVGRPFVPAVYGAGSEGVDMIYNKLKTELVDTMTMCGAHSLAEITAEKIYIEK